ncbi:MAG: hypothetical protein MJZ40_00540 [Bacteroidaceae bacterium]|nr:hypothetical protein [Bacteroidaceae bacterium]
MKKYITPAVELTAMRAEGVIATSFSVGGTTGTGEDQHEIVVGGGKDDSDNGIGQLTTGYGWSTDDWSE